MIALILLALGLGAALTVYELSPRTRSRVDAYARAIRSAHAAHQTADAHLGNVNAAASAAVRHTQLADAARQAAPQPTPTPFVQPTLPIVQPSFVQPTPMPPPVQPTPMPPPVQPTPMPPTAPPASPFIPTPTVPTPEPAPVPLPPVPAQDVADAQVRAAQAATDAAVDHVAATIEANQSAARNTAEAAKNAQDEAQRQAAAQSAAKVVERENKIQVALDSLGLGQCGVKPYEGVTPRVKDALLAKLRSEGMKVTGDNPWNIDTGIYGVKLRAVWDWRVDKLKLIVTTGKGLIVTCDRIWERIDPKVKGIIGSWR